ncbi:MAG: ATPase [Xanthobacteraceae bacterium]|nr:ATPase [Xanthobacteraceae bacterium]
MRDIFDDISKNQPLDPTESARRNMRPQLRRRFYQAVSVEPKEGGYAVLLDGRPVKTPARRALAAPTQALAQAIADEWDAQREVVDPAAMPLTRLANSIIDGVAEKPDAVKAEIAKFLGSDLVCYRADSPDGLVARQTQYWNPLIAFARDALGARFVLGEGVMFVTQPDEAIAAAARAIPDEPWKLGAVSAVTSLTGSALIALALAQGALSAADAWAAAHVDEDWNMHQWGRDEQALERRAAREAEMQAAAKVLALL